MLFHTYHFLIFFSIVFSIYWLLPSHRVRKIWLLVASCYFYMSWNPWLISLILLSASVDYLVALRLPHIASQSIRRTLLICSICTNLGLLLFFKYTNFFLDSVVPVINLFGLGLRPPLFQLILPLGISFYTFETISYIVDVYQRRQQPVRNILDYALYIMFFPHLVAGPIVRPHDFLPQLATPKRWSWFRLQIGMQLFLLGLFKKAVIADSLAPIVDMVFLKPDAFDSAAIWFAVLSYAVQIYCDFSGYSDMAIGLAHTFGYSLPQNFRLPYLAADISEFWKRWHITLSTWLRDYLYIPLGGNRHGPTQTHRNLLLTMLLGGLWHGASWTFAIWGLYHGALLIAHRACPRPDWLKSPTFRPVCVLGTFLSVCVGWVFFRAQRVEDAADILIRMVRPTSGTSLTAIAALVGGSFLVLVVCGHLVAGHADFRKRLRRLSPPVMGAALGTLVLFIQLLIPEASQAFIYFQF
jgi:alginate O-acetyltransferase complex protein AlgI